MADDVYHTKMTSWLTVGLLTVASILYGFALPLRSLTLTIVATLVLVAGLVTAAVYRIMDDVH